MVKSMLLVSYLFSSSKVEEGQNRKDAGWYDDIPGNTCLIRTNPRTWQFWQSYADSGRRKINGSQPIGTSLSRADIGGRFRDY